MENKIIVSQNFIYAFAKTVGEGHGLNKGKTVIEIITGEVPVAPATGNDILIDNFILLYSDGKIRMQYDVSDPDPDDGYGT